MQNRRELVSRRIAILAEQAAGARQAGTRVDLIEAQIEGWTHVLAMFDAGVLATTERVVTIHDHEIAALDTSREAYRGEACDSYVVRRLTDARFDFTRPFTATRFEGSKTEYRQGPMLPCAS